MNFSRDEYAQMTQYGTGDFRNLAQDCCDLADALAAERTAREAAEQANE